MTIFSDLHHDGLWRSLEFLFEKRLNHKLYRPVGMEWFPKWWKVATPYGDDPRTATQYLGLRGSKPKEDSYYFDGIKGLTFEQFKEKDIDIVIASIPDHLQVYSNLIKEYKPKAKLIFQIGNHFGLVDYSLAKNILVSTSKFRVPEDINIMFYHQEFDLNVFHTYPLIKNKIIRSFVHTLPTAEHFKSDWEDFLELEGKMKDWKFESYGASCREGCIDKIEDIAKLMGESMFGFNLKTGGDGYGHIIHNWFAIGKPVIYRGSQYKDKLAGEILEHNITGIDLDIVGIDGAIKMLENMEYNKYVEMCNNVSNKFIQKVNFDKEQKDIENFLSKLK